jgi:ribosomal protein L2
LRFGAHDLKNHCRFPLLLPCRWDDFGPLKSLKFLNQFSGTFKAYFGGSEAMKLIKAKPITNGMRHQLNIAKNMLAKDNTLGKSTIKHLHNCKGRSPQTGHITSWHRGGGAKQAYREIDFSNRPRESIVLTTMYDPYRSGFINFNFDLKDKSFFRTVSTDKIYPGTLLTCSAKPDELKLGTRTKLCNIPPGTFINMLSKGKPHFLLH